MRNRILLPVLLLTCALTLVALAPQAAAASKPQIEELYAGPAYEDPSKVGLAVHLAKPNASSVTITYKGRAIKAYNETAFPQFWGALIKREKGKLCYSFSATARNKAGSTTRSGRACLKRPQRLQAQAAKPDVTNVAATLDKAKGKVIVTAQTKNATSAQIQAGYIKASMTPVTSNLYARGFPRSQFYGVKKGSEITVKITARSKSGTKITETWTVRVG